MPREAGLYSGVSPACTCRGPCVLVVTGQSRAKPGLQKHAVSKAHSLRVHLWTGGGPLKGYTLEHGSLCVDSGSLRAQSTISGLTSC